MGTNRLWLEITLATNVVLHFTTECEMKNAAGYKNQNVYLKINIYLNQATTPPFRPVLSLYRNQSTDLWRKSMEWFLYNGNTGLDWNKLIKTTNFSIYYFLLSWRNPSPLYPSVQPNQTYFSQKHKKNANWKFSKQ